MKSVRAFFVMILTIYKEGWLQPNIMKKRRLISAGNLLVLSLGKAVQLVVRLLAWLHSNAAATETIPC